jgi:hypothetical protein
MENSEKPKGGRVLHDEPIARRPYQPPAIEESSEFETLALACGQSAGPGCIRTGGLQNS